MALPSSLAQRSRGVAGGGKSKGRTAFKCRESTTKMSDFTNQVSLFLSLKLGGIGIMWVLSNNFFLKVIDSKLLKKILWYATITSSQGLSTANRL